MGIFLMDDLAKLETRTLILHNGFVWGFVPGIMYEKRGQIHEALSAYISALLLQPCYVPCKILISGLLLKMGPVASPVARGLLADALRIEPTNRLAWYYLGLVHKDDGRMADATDCFQAASMLEESDPVETFNSVV